MNILNLVPQFYTQNRKWPYLVLEKFNPRPDKTPKNVFVAKIYIEFKRAENTNDPLPQTLKAIANQTERR